MPKIINAVKTVLKKYLPDTMYFFFYKVFKYGRYFLSDHNKREKEELSLIHFTKPLYKKVLLDDISFEIKLDPHNGLVDKEIYSKGVWEADMLREIRTHLRTDSTCLDIGSNIGQHALYMAKVAKNGKIYAFDPIKKLTDQIHDSVTKNNLTNIEVCNFGLSNTNEVKDIYLNNLNMGNTTFKKRLGASDVIKAETKIFDEFWHDRGVIDFVKIDVEGYEFYALQGMRKSIEKYHPKMIVEFSPIFYNKMDISSEEFLHYIFDLGYKIYDLDDKRKEITKNIIPEFLKRVETQTNILCI